MPFAFDPISCLIGLVAGAVAVWVVLRGAAAGATARLQVAEEQLETLRAERAEHESRILALHAERAELSTALAKERESTAEKLAVLTDAQAKLQDAFRALSADALARNNQSFLELARTQLEAFQQTARTDLEQRQKAIADLVRPMVQSLEKMDGQIQELEKARAGAYEGLKTQLGALVQTQDQLRSETSNLVRALRSPSVRGRWGEIQLKRVVEMAGMLEHCDFSQQASVTGDDNGRLRPDLLVRLPGGKIIVVDAKTPLEAYLDGCEATDDEARRLAMVRHARHVRDHMKSLGGKAYWSQFNGQSPEFVVMFLPGENFFSAALESDPSLIEAGIDQSVIPATPTTLIALLRAVSYGWRQERLAENARHISQVGRELYERLTTMGDHMAALGQQLGRSVDSYNKAVGSLESRVLVTARRLKDLDAAPENAEIRELAPIDRMPRHLQAPEMRALAPAAED